MVFEKNEVDYTALGSYSDPNMCMCLLILRIDYYLSDKISLIP